jgi:hypothetical protein
VEQIISKKEVDELMDIKGEVRGVVFETTSKFIVKEEGEEGLRKLEQTMAELGHPLKISEVRKLDFYPLGLWGLFLLSIERLFNYDDEKFRELGESNAKFSIIIRLFMKYFFSPEKVMTLVSKMWRKYYTEGVLKKVEFNKKEKYLILRIENFHFHQLLCKDLIGYFAAVTQMIFKDKVTCKETKCVHRGDKYHEFLLTW